MGGGRARRIEHRIAGADANPYLVMAAMLAGFHHGLANKLTPTQPSTGNAGEEADPDMPLRLWSALDRLEGSSLMATYFGPRYLSAYAAIKRSEFGMNYGVENGSLGDETRVIVSMEGVVRGG